MQKRHYLQTTIHLRLKAFIVVLNNDKDLRSFLIILKKIAMINHLKFLIVATLFALNIAACTKDIEQISITNIEVGHDNIAFKGMPLHVEIDIIAPERIRSVSIAIHSESVNNGWKFNQLYLEYDGLLNVTFHKDIDIPDLVTPGIYHFLFTVVDHSGQSKEIETNFELKDKPTNASQISGLEAHVAQGGKDLHITAHITSPNKIDKVVIEIEGPMEKELTYDKMRGETHFDFSEHIDIAQFPVGHYDFHFTVVDLQGNKIEQKGHFNK